MVFLAKPYLNLPPMDTSGDHAKRTCLVDQRECSSSSTSSPIRKKRTYLEKLGFYNTFVLALGTVAIFLALAFVIFLWKDADNALRGRHYSRLWILVVENSWLSKVVTLSTVVIRTAVTAQLAVFASLVAALILETAVVRTADLPLLSIIRCSNTGPQSLFHPAVHSVPVRSHLGYSVIIILAILNAIVMQFSSTILLTDVQQTSFAMEPAVSITAFGVKPDGESLNTFSKINVYTGIDYWSSGPAYYSPFAEYNEVGAISADFIDTGKTYRGFFPSTGGSVRRYTGPMTVLDMRTLCVKPIISNATIYFDEGDMANLRGTLNVANIHSDVVVEAHEISITFNCIFAYSTPIDQPAGFWPLSLCAIDLHNATLLGGIQPQGHLNKAQLLLNSTFLGTVSGSNSLPLTPRNTSASAWARYAGPNMTVDGSLCFMDPYPLDYQATAWTSNDLLSQGLVWDEELESYRTAPVIAMLGATDTILSLDQRGLYHLDHSGNWTDATVQRVYGDSLSSVSYLWDVCERYQLSNSTFTSWSSTFVTWGMPGIAAHRKHVAIIQDILRKTANPALALQALYTILMQMAYNDFQSEFNVKAPAKLSVSTSASIPTQWTGLGVILGVLMLHFVLITTALVLFLKKTEMSLLGNAWQAVSQVHSVDTADVVHYGASATDAEVNNKVHDRVCITRSTASGRTEATYIRRRNGIIGNLSEE